MSDPACDASHGCITCSDEGIPMRVVELREDAAVCVDEEGAAHEVMVDLVGPVESGRRILVHAGVAIGAL